MRVGGDNQFQAPKVDQYHFIRAEERVLGLWLRLGQREKLYPRPSCPEEGWLGSGGRGSVCLCVCNKETDGDGVGGVQQDY